MNSITTIDVQFEIGGEWAEVFVSKGYFPSNLKFDYKSCHDVTCNQHTIIFRPNNQLRNELNHYSQDDFRTTTFIICIHHKSVSCYPSLNYRIWCLGSTNPPQSDQIKKVSETTTALNKLSENSNEELWNNLPKLQRQAHLQSKPKLKDTNKQSISDDISTFPEIPLEERDDAESFENFITKAGRMKIKNSHDISKFSNSPIESSRHEIPVNPNFHSDLFDLVDSSTRDGNSESVENDIMLPKILDRTSESYSQNEAASTYTDSLPFLTIPSLHKESQFAKSKIKYPKFPNPVVQKYKLTK